MIFSFLYRIRESHR